MPGGGTISIEAKESGLLVGDDPALLINDDLRLAHGASDLILPLSHGSLLATSSPIQRDFSSASRSLDHFKLAPHALNFALDLCQ